MLGEAAADVRKHTEEINVETVMTDLRRGVDHLHLLGLIHVRVSYTLLTLYSSDALHTQGDINPNNIMLDSCGSAILNAHRL
jgi:hypothetical protein